MTVRRATVVNRQSETVVSTDEILRLKASGSAL